MNTLLCPKPDATYLFMSDLVPDILYYSHIPAMIIMLLLGIFVFVKNREALLNQLMLFLGVVFSLWTVFNLIVWADYDTRIVMFLWSLLIFLEPLIFGSAAYLVYVYVYQKDVPTKWKVAFGILLLPFLVLLPTQHTLYGITLSEACEGPEGFLAIQYAYPVAMLIILWIVVMSFIAYRKEKLAQEKKRIAYITFGTVLFLLSFSWGNLISSVTENWQISQYGMFGVPIFAALMGYLIVRYQAFNIKLFGTQVLVVAILTLISSQYFYVQSWQNIILIGITLILVLIGGYLLIRAVQGESQRKTELQNMADRLAMANQRLKKLDKAKSEFISIASHQLRTPLTSIKGFISLILEGTYGKVSPEVQNALNKVYLSNERLIQLVEDLLNISRIESGRLQFKIEKTDIIHLIQDTVEMFALKARDKGLELKVHILDDEDIPNISIDANKIREVISNLVDNAIKYTQKGNVTISLHRHIDTVRIVVSDTGMGVSPEDMPYLFQKFSRGKDVGRIHATGTGLGLYVGKNLVEAHNGKIWMESDGKEKGSKFYIELPIVYSVESEGNFIESE